MGGHSMAGGLVSLTLLLGSPFVIERANAAAGAHKSLRSANDRQEQQQKPQVRVRRYFWWLRRGLVAGENFGQRNIAIPGGFHDTARRNIFPVVYVHIYTVCNWGKYRLPEARP